MEEIRKNPYNYICNYAEEILPSIGKRVFMILSLMPPALCLPPIIINGQNVRSNINTFFLAPPSSGKSRICGVYNEFAYKPQTIKSITHPALVKMLTENPECAIIIDDFAQCTDDLNVIKTLESAIEEKKVNRILKFSEYKDDVNVDALICGVPLDLSVYLGTLSGMIFRCMPIFVTHSVEAHSEIGKKIANGVGEDSIQLKTEKINKFYEELREIQYGENKDIPPITKFDIKKELLMKGYEKWDSASRELLRQAKGFNWFREYQDFIRVMNAHAFLNVFNNRTRKISETESALVPNEEDAKIAELLMLSSMRFKSRLLKSEGMAQGVKSANDFQELMNSKSIPQDAKDLIRNIYRGKKHKGGKLVF